MTTIDIENAKQIRQPMDVIIQIAAAETATLTYSGYSAAKVADGELDEPTWPMRKLADLQGDGFLLDGSAVLYDSTVTSSAANGKLGVRSVIGTAVSVTVTSDVALQYLTVTASGAESVTYNGTAYSMTSGYALIPVGGGTSFTLTFTPATADERIEISDIQPGALIRITNENLISAVVSLRSDLSILEPTLPESEINIEAYFDEDISDILASIPDETPVTYQAGYEGDMSPVRKFYLSEQITWADNIMSIHAVDAVHLLDEEIPTAMAMTWESTVRPGAMQNANLKAVYEYMNYLVGSAGIYLPEYSTASIDNQANPIQLTDRCIVKKQSRRDLICLLMQLLHQDYPEGHFFNGRTSFWPTYVDAGIPTLSTDKPSSEYMIYESDCANVIRNADRKITGIDCEYYSIDEDSWDDNREIGSVTWMYEVGGFLQFDSEFIYSYDTRYIIEQTPTSWEYVDISPLYENGADGGFAYFGIASYGDGSRKSGGRYLIGNDIPKGLIVGWSGNNLGKDLYTQVIPWSTRQARMWQNVFGADTTTQSAGIYGEAFTPYKTVKTFGSDGNKVSISNDSLIGKIQSRGTAASGGATVVCYPDGAYNSLLERSNITGSFTWKGDPRMQPRDVFTFHRLDGTDEVCTLENITITHERGGTFAEITYRKGVC